MAPSQNRFYADDAPAQDRSHKPSSEPIEHVSEEAAKTAQIMGEKGPDMNQGTPVEDVRSQLHWKPGTLANNCQIVKGDKEAQKNLPKVMQDAIKQGNKTPAPKGSRSYSTMTTRSNEGADMGLVDFEAASKLPVTPGLKFEAPTLPLPKDGHVKHRYDPVVEQVTNLLMRHGKKSVAQRVRRCSRVFWKSTALTIYHSKWQ
jgi:small subunit ribosomal protein S7